MSLKLHLRDRNPAVVAAWRYFFDDVPDVTISEGDILELGGDAIVSPANSFGWMDGGIDLAYRERFGTRIERVVQTGIQTAFDGELPVGQAFIVGTDDSRIQNLVVAPTMRVPGPVIGTVNAYLAMRAALLAARERPDVTLLCPGLCTLTGRMSPHRAAFQMRHAWRDAIQHEGSASPLEIGFWHRHMVTIG